MEKKELTHIDLFTGIGGFTLACAWNGIKTEVFCERDEPCRRFLNRTYPNVPIIPDIREFDGTRWRGRFLLTAGVPCQPASRAGKQRGKADDRWLWPEALRVVSEARPDWVLFENPLGINDVGLDGILAYLEGLDYEVSPPLIIPACAVNSPQLRNRYWIVAHSKGNDDRREPGGFCETDEQQAQERQEGRISESANSSQSHMAHRDDSGSNTQGHGGYSNGSEEVQNGRHKPLHRACGPCEGHLEKPIGTGTRSDQREACDQGGEALGSWGEGIRQGDREACPNGIATASQSHMAHSARRGEESRATGRTPDKPVEADGCDESSQSHMADTGTEGHQGCRIESSRTIRTELAEQGERRIGFDGLYRSSNDFWKSSVWLPCADGKVRRAPDNAFLLADGVQPRIHQQVGQERATWPTVLKTDEGHGHNAMWSATSFGIGNLVYGKGKGIPKDSKPMEAKTIDLGLHRSILAALGNSIVPQVAAEVIRAIVSTTQEENDVLTEK